jgi:hypothetical protein
MQGGTFGLTEATRHAAVATDQQHIAFCSVNLIQLNYYPHFQHTHAHARTRTHTHTHLFQLYTRHECLITNFALQFIHCSSAGHVHHVAALVKDITTLQHIRRDGKVQKTDYSFQVRLWVRMEKLGSHWTEFHEIWYLKIFGKSVEKIQISFKSYENNGYFT